MRNVEVVSPQGSFSSFGKWDGHHLVGLSIDPEVRHEIEESIVEGECGGVVQGHYWGIQ